MVVHAVKFSGVGVVSDVQRPNVTEAGDPVRNVLIKVPQGKGETLIRVAAWRKLSGVKLKEGDRVLVSGEVRRHEWPVKDTEPDGKKNGRLEVIVDDAREGRLEVASEEEDLNCVQGTGEIVHVGERTKVGSKDVDKLQLLVCFDVMNAEGKVVRGPGVSVVVFGKTARKEFVVGNRVSVEGEINNQKWEQGEDNRYAADVVVSRGGKIELLDEAATA